MEFLLSLSRAKVAQIGLVCAKIFVGGDRIGGGENFVSFAYFVVKNAIILAYR